MHITHQHPCVLPAGHELYLRSIAYCGIPEGHTCTFAEVVEQSRLLKESALGYITPEEQLVLAPPADHVHTFTRRHKIVVIAEE